MQSKSVALVTGANQGIGLQIARDLYGQGLTVLVGSRDLAKGERAAADIGYSADAIQLDITYQAQIDAAAERLRPETGDAADARRALSRRETRENGRWR